MPTINQADLSEALVGPFVGPAGTISEGPFVINHNNVESFGAHLMQDGENITVFDGNTVREFNDKYAVTVSDDTIQFDSDFYDSHYTLRPVTLADQAILSSGSTDATTDAEFAESIYYGLLQNGLLGDETADYPQNGDNVTTQPVTAAAATPEDRAEGSTIYVLVDDDGTTVTDLMKTDANGYYVRDNETWQALDPDADEESDPQYFDKDWIKVNADAIEQYDDDVASKDTLNKDEFSQYIIPWSV